MCDRRESPLELQLPNTKSVYSDRSCLKLGVYFPCLLPGQWFQLNSHGEKPVDDHLRRSISLLNDHQLPKYSTRFINSIIQHSKVSWMLGFTVKMNFPVASKRTQYTAVRCPRDLHWSWSLEKKSDPWTLYVSGTPYSSRCRTAKAKNQMSFIKLRAEISN